MNVRCWDYPFSHSLDSAIKAIKEWARTMDLAEVIAVDVMTTGGFGFGGMNKQGGMNNQVGICVVGFAFCFGDNHCVGRIRPESKQQYGWVWRYE